MLKITNKQIDLDRSEILYEKPFSKASLMEDFEISGGTWTVEEGWLTGLFRENAGALVYLKKEFPGDILLDFIGRTVPPCDNDLNFTFKTKGWDYEKNDADRGYIGGLGGWWDNKAGIEHYPQCTPWASTELLKLESGKEYHIQTGSIGDHCFLIVDGVIVTELYDPNAEEFKDCHRVGLGSYCSHVQFRDFKVIRPYWEKTSFVYTPKF